MKIHEFSLTEIREMLHNLPPARRPGEQRRVIVPQREPPAFIREDRPPSMEDCCYDEIVLESVHYYDPRWSIACTLQWKIITPIKVVLDRQ